MLIQERATKEEDGRGGIIPFWNTAPPEDSLRSWERRKEKRAGGGKKAREGNEEAAEDRHGLG